MVPTIGHRDRLVVDTPDAYRIDVALILLRLGVDEWVAVDLACGGEHKADTFEASETNELWVPNAPTLRIGIGMREKPLGLAGEAKW